MELSSASDAHLTGHYAGLGDLKADFRNYNLFTLVVSKVAGECVLDIGCGAGALLDLVRAQGKSVVGLEPSHDIRARALKSHPGRPVIEGRAEDVDTLVR